MVGYKRMIYYVILFYDNMIWVNYVLCCDHEVSCVISLYGCILYFFFVKLTLAIVVIV